MLWGYYIIIVYNIYREKRLSDFAQLGWNKNTCCPTPLTVVPITYCRTIYETRPEKTQKKQQQKTVTFLPLSISICTYTNIILYTYNRKRVIGMFCRQKNAFRPSHKITIKHHRPSQLVYLCIRLCVNDGAPNNIPRRSNKSSVYIVIYRNGAHMNPYSAAYGSPYPATTLAGHHQNIFVLPKNAPIRIVHKQLSGHFFVIII